MTVRFFMLMGHYASTLDFSNAALQAAEKGLNKLTNAVEALGKLVDEFFALRGRELLDGFALQESVFHLWVVGSKGVFVPDFTSHGIAQYDRCTVAVEVPVWSISCICQGIPSACKGNLLNRLVTPSGASS